MASWRKLLARVLGDRRPVGYHYDELASLLVNHLGFQLAKPVDGSHRRFRRRIADPERPGEEKTVSVGLLAPGLQKPEYVKELVQVLLANDLVPDGVRIP